MTADYGTTWTSRPAPEGAYVSDFASPTTGFVFTTDQAGREILKTDDGGATWRALADPIADPMGAESAGANFDVMAAPSAETLVLGGVVTRFQDCDWQTRVAVYVSRDGGETFSSTEFPFPGVVHQIEMLDDLHGVMLASEWKQRSNHEECSSTSESVALRAFVTHDGATTWKPFADEPFRFAAPPTELGVHSVGIASPRRLLLGMTDGRILVSNDGGETFSRARGTRNASYPEIDPHYLSRIEFINFANAWVGYATSAHGAVWKTRDGGSSWRQERSWQAAGEYSFSSGLAVANRKRALVAAHTVISSRVPLN